MKAQMKIGMFVATVLLATSAQAVTTFCGISGENYQIENQFDRSLAMKQFTADGKVSYIVDKKANSAEEFGFESLKTFEDWKKVDGKNVVFIEVKENQATLYLGRISLKDSKNVTKILSTAIGGLVPGKPVLLMQPSANMAVSCTQY